MYKLFLILFIGCLVSCDNSSSKKDKADSPKVLQGIPADSNARVATFNFIDECMNNAKITLGDQKAYAFCKCIYAQLKAENPGADSIAIEGLATDTARIAKMAANCR